MIFYIHSSYGVLEATPMTVQAIKNSIPEQVSIEAEQDSEVTGSLTEACDVSSELASQQTTVDNP